MGIASKGNLMVVNFSRSCNEMSCLMLRYCKELTDKSFTKVAKRLSSVRILDLGYCYRLTDESLICISNTCKELKRLYLNHCNSFTDHGIELVCASCHTITFLNISYCQELTIKSLISTKRILKRGGNVFQTIEDSMAT